MALSIGEILHKTREEKGIALNDVENETKIRRKYLQALENDNFDVLPGKVYVKGFLKSYAKYLGLDGETLINHYEGQDPVQAEVEQLAETLAKTNVKKPAKMHRGLIAVVAILLVGVLVYWLGTVGTSLEQEDISSGEPKQNMSTNNSSGADNSTETSNHQGGTADTVPAQEGINVVLEVTDRDCWMCVVVDEDEDNAFVETVTPGNSKKFEGEKSIWFNLGDAGAVKVLVNGKDHGFLGANGSVVKKVVKAGENGVTIEEG